MLYERDYKTLTPEETALWNEAKEKYGDPSSAKIIMSSVDFVNYVETRPKAVDFHLSLFPNNYLPQGYLNKDELKKTKEEFEKILNKGVSEREILQFIREKKAYPIVGSIFKRNYQFGHHGAYLFKEFELPPNYVADFLLVGKGSGGYEFIFVEFEAVIGNITMADGNFGQTIRKGISQINDWDGWIESNFSHLKLVFNKHVGLNDKMPNEFFELEKNRIHYVVIAGRRNDYKEKTYKLRRKYLRESNILILHYDNLLDSTDQLISDMRY